MSTLFDQVPSESPAKIVAQTDGGSRGNPGPAGLGYVLKDASTGEVLAEGSRYLGQVSNNVAEYQALVDALTHAQQISPDARVQVQADSKLVVEQMSGRWKIKHPDMQELAIKARAIFPASAVTFEWIPREQNKQADRLANEAMDRGVSGDIDDVEPVVLGNGSDARAGSVNSAGSAVSASEGLSIREIPGDPGKPTAQEDAAEEANGENPEIRIPVFRQSPATTLVLVRHGRTHLTEQGRVSGTGGEDAPLSKLGLQDARQAADSIGRINFRLKQEKLPPISTILASPLQRAQQTAAAIAESLDQRAITAPEFSEISFGAWDGLTYQEISTRWPEEFQAWLNSVHATPPGGEPATEFTERIYDGLAKVTSDYAGQTVAVVCHTVPIRAVLAHALDAGLGALWRIRLAPASFSMARFWTEGGSEILSVNDTHHLQ